MDMLVDLAPAPAEDDLRAAFRRDVLAGLAQPRKAIPARWFYDHRGSELFEAITDLPEYYPTRTEVAILEEHGAAIAAAVGPGRTVVEFGAGSATKTPLLLNRIEPAAYVALDISGDFLREACAVLARRYPDLPVHAIEADFTRPAALPADLDDAALLGFFPGSTIGNLEPAGAVDLLRSMRQTLGRDAMLLIGMDLVKDTAVLTAAYDDGAGVTAAFNLNLATRINRELAGTLPLDALRHRAVWNEARARIEMHLEATRDIAFTVAGQAFAMAVGETIHTENSHKYATCSATTLLLAGGWDPITEYRDADRLFSVVVAQALDEGVGP